MMLRYAAGALAAAVLLLTGAAPALAQPSFPPLTGRVVDGANILTPPQEAALTAKLQTLETATGRQLVVATIPSLGGYPIEDYGYQLGRAWGIGQKGRDDGALFLIAPADRETRIEVGYGLEPVLTDALSSIILQTAVLPRFRDGDMAGGVIAGTDAIIGQLSLDDGTAKARVAAAEQEAPDGGGLPLWVIIAIIIVMLVIRMPGGRRRRSIWGAAIPTILLGGRGRGGWSGGDWGGGGGGFSGGGGSFGGGGASGRW